MATSQTGFVASTIRKASVEKEAPATVNAKIARTICQSIERASILARENKLSNEKGLRLIRDACKAIAENRYRK